MLRHMVEFFFRRNIMQRRFITLFILAAIALCGSARQPGRGYRGFIDWNNSITTYEVWYPGNSMTYYYTGVATSHGYQFNPYLFIGAGLSIDYCHRDGSIEVPLFLQARGDLKFGRFTPFLDLRGGYTLTDGGGWNLSPTIGYRFNWGRKVGINVGVGLLLKGYTIEAYSVEFDQITSNWNLIHEGQAHRVKAMFAFRVGLDF